ncbi:TPA: hypothetical protein SIA28_004065 [Aeromonas salmonicida]|nr:hypothetical protein [Aeromonas salmonicida]HEH9424203.1 hypothetical protein [Aeromonas salmonicida]HEH9437449.1 hypothetical protein [Aeromonas salmonicida]
MIEFELASVLKTYNPNVHMFEVPDTDTSTEALAVRYIADRSNTKYYNKEREIKIALFHVARVVGKLYSALCNDIAFTSILNKYNGNSILDIKITNQEDSKLDTGKFERLYTVEVTYLYTYQ